MKKSYLFLAPAALVMVGCATNDEYADATDQLGTTGDGTIIFSPKGTNATRATLSGSQAADSLHGEFVVYATKHLDADEDKTNNNDAIAFQNYTVRYLANTAGTSSSNTANWEYVGMPPYAGTVVSPFVTSQTIKYWDYSANHGYTFTAFAGSGLMHNEKLLNNFKVVKIQSVTGQGSDNLDKYSKGYWVVIPDNVTLDSLYFSDRVEVAKADYNKPVVLTFRNFGSKVRVGFYETVPGYSVKIDTFFCDKDAAAPVTTYKAMTDGNTQNFVAALQNVNPKANSLNTVTVTYSSEESNKNQPIINTGSGCAYQYTFSLGKGINSADKLAESSSQPTWDNNGAYTTVYPNLSATQPMLIRCSYTLTSTDGSGETIHVKNARVLVPVQYVQWKSNYAYTYLFKISENSNGTSGNVPTDPDDPSSGDKEGLYPITFDAMVEQASDYTQETVSTFASNTVTSYALKSDVTTDNEYKPGAEVYFVTSGDDKAIVAPSAIGVEEKDAQVYSMSGMEGATEADVIAQLTGIKNGLTLTEVTGASLESTVPSADGTTISVGSNGAVKFAVPSTNAATAYAYVYCTTKYAAATYSTENPTSFEEGTTYYYKTTGDNPVYYPASGITKDNFNTYKSSLYTQTNAGTAGVYTVKVIKVKE